MAQNYSTLYLMISHRDFSWNILAWWETCRQRQTKVTLVSFPRNPFLVQLGNLGTIWVKIMQPYGTSNCISWYALWEFWKVYLKNFLPGKSNWSDLGQNYPTLCSMTLRILLKFFGMMDKNLPLEQYGPNLVQNYTTCINCSRDF